MEVDDAPEPGFAPGDYVEDAELDRILPTLEDTSGFAPGDFVDDHHLPTVLRLVSETSRRKAEKAEEWRLVAEEQGKGLALSRVPRVKYVIVISGGRIRSPALAAKAYANKIKCPSLHFIGDNDFAKTHGEELADSFVDPLVIRHPAGHTVPRLDEKGLQGMLSYLDKIEGELLAHHLSIGADSSIS
ncbi:hypothetical protein ACQ4PT_024948 [Festuca glaucescens]